MEQKEAELERKCCEWAWQQYKIRNIKVYKKQGWADRVFFRGPICLFMEFKRQGELPRKLQKHVLDILTNEGTPAYWCDNFESFKIAINFWVQKYDNKTSALDA